MIELLKKPLPPSEVNLSVKKIITKNDKKYVLCLLHKTSRADMAILDQVFGIDGWSSEIELIDKEEVDGRKIYYCRCVLTLKTGDGEIKRSDMGEGYSLKGSASDAFKRVCFQVGIGRHLYYMPQVWLTFDNKMSDRDLALIVSTLDVNYTYEGNKLISLEVIDKKGNTLYSYKSK